MTIHIAHARATGKRKFKGRTFFFAGSQQMPVLFPQPTILALGRCQRLLNGSPYEHLYMKQQSRYAFSTVNRTHIYIAIQRACCPPVYSLLNVPCWLMYDLDYCHKTHDRACGLGHNQWGRSRSPKMLSIALYSMAVTAPTQLQMGWPHFIAMLMMNLQSLYLSGHDLIVLVSENTQ